MTYLGNKLKATAVKHLRRKNRTNTIAKLQRAEVRVVVQRSNKFVSAQALDLDGKVIASVTDKTTAGGSKKENANKAGQAFAKTLKAKKVTKVLFDRNGILYHGRIAAFADGMREGGLAL